MNDKLIYIKENIQLRLIDFKSFLEYKVAAIKRYFTWLSHALLNRTHHIISDIEDNVLVWSDALDAAEGDYNKLVNKHRKVLEELATLKGNLTKKPKK